MMTFFWSHGHLGWGLFYTLVFTLSAILVVDLIWRLVRISAKALVFFSAFVWFIGIIFIITIS